VNLFQEMLIFRLRNDKSIFHHENLSQLPINCIFSVSRITISHESNVVIPHIIMASFNLGNSIKPRVDHPLIDVHLIECISKMPTDILTDNILGRILCLF
jgi:hypothetical protein